MKKERRTKEQEKDGEIIRPLGRDGGEGRGPKRERRDGEKAGKRLFVTSHTVDRLPILLSGQGWVAGGYTREPRLCVGEVVQGLFVFGWLEYLHTSSHPVHTTEENQLDP